MGKEEGRAKRKPNMVARRQVMLKHQRRYTSVLWDVDRRGKGRTPMASTMMPQPNAPTVRPVLKAVKSRPIWLSTRQTPANKMKIT